MHGYRKAAAASLFPPGRCQILRKSTPRTYTRLSIRAESSARSNLALKEWAVTVAALGNGDQTILLRKGGIREPAFQLPSDQFFLLPNAFHSDAHLLRDEYCEKYAEELARDPKTEPRLQMNVYAQVTGKWQTSDKQALLDLQDFHIWSEKFILDRLSWRPKQPFTVLEVQCSKTEVVYLKNKDRYWGCFSFVDLPEEEIKSSGQIQTTLYASEFQSKQKALRDLLSQHNVESLL